MNTQLVPFLPLRALLKIHLLSEAFPGHSNLKSYPTTVLPNTSYTPPCFIFPFHHWSPSNTFCTCLLSAIPAGIFVRTATTIVIHCCIPSAWNNVWHAVAWNKNLTSWFELLVVSSILFLSFNFLICKMGNTPQRTGQRYLDCDDQEGKGNLHVSLYLHCLAPDRHTNLWEENKLWWKFKRQSMLLITNPYSIIGAPCILITMLSKAIYLFGKYFLVPSCSGSLF